MPFVATPGSTLFFTLAGSPAAPAIVFSNSLGTTHRMWDAVVEELAPEFCCIRYDTRGHGQSVAKAETFEIADLAQDVLALLDHLNLGPVHFAGLSLGGMIGQTLAILHPDRLASLTLMATSSFMPPASAWLERAALVRAQGAGAIADGAMARWFTDAFLMKGGVEVERARKTLVDQPREGYAACCEAIARMDLRAQLGAIHTRTLIIAGEDDPATPPAMSEFLRDHIAGSRLERLTPAAHLLAVEQPANVARLLSGFVREE